MDFDSDSELYGHLSREMVSGAVQLTEAVLQKDLLSAAGVNYYAGTATTKATVTAEGAGAAIVDYEDLVRLSIVLDDNRTPKQTKVITGSRMQDTKTIAAGRVMYVGSELMPHLLKMVDSFGNAAFTPVQHYADAGTILNGEQGTIGQFRIVVVPEMQHWDGSLANSVGAAVSSNPGYRATGGYYNVYPMLVVGDEAFTTIGFQTDGKTVKFDITTKKPGKETADRNDPYGELGFSSIKWYYGFMSMRPERIAVLYTVAPV
jgi:N4-gp56 family major capsid protein